MTSKKDRLYVGREMAIETQNVDTDVKLTIDGMLMKMSATLDVNQAKYLVSQLNRAIELAELEEKMGGC